jgi:hypothetical protein
MSADVTMACEPRPVVSNTATMTPAATQEPLPELRQAATAAPVAVRSRRPAAVSRGSIVGRERHRVRRQQIIRRQRG